MSLSDNINKALNLVPDSFIAYYTTNHEYDTITIMHRYGVCMCRISWYHNDDEEVILDSLDVSKAFRRKGYGLMLQELREAMGIALGAKRSTLWAVDGWVQKWYERRGYRFCENDHPWMKKNLV